MTRPDSQHRSSGGARRPFRPAVRPGLSSAETLEPRLYLSGDTPLAGDGYLTLSFAADGVSAAGQTSALYSKLNALAPEAVWKDAVLRAFQTWATRTNADIGVVADGGQSFGAPGAISHDPRFGDIRVGAIAMDPSVGAVSVAIGGVVGGTWAGDVLINTQFPFQSVDDLFGVVLHEAGNVFGLPDNDDPNSPLHSGTIPTATVPTAADEAALQARYGVRRIDANEVNTSGGSPTTDNDSFANATRISVSEVLGAPKGSLPTIVSGDITTVGDTDYFRFQNADGYTGPLRFEVRTEGVSLLAPRLRVYDRNELLVGEAAVTDLGGGRAVVTLPVSAAERDYYAVVDAAAGSAFDRGGYSLVVTVEGRNTLSMQQIDSYTGGLVRGWSVDRIAELLDPSAGGFYESDGGADDTLATAQAVVADAAFAPGVHYQSLGSISTPGDVDYYLLKSPSTGGGVATIVVRSTSPGALIPTVGVQDEDGVAYPTTVLANGQGLVVVQAVGVPSHSDLFVRVAASAQQGAFAEGNYELVASFGATPTDLTEFASGTLAVGPTVAAHTLYAARPQLFHFVLGASTAPAPGPAGVVAIVRDASGAVVARIVTPLGETRSEESVLLSPGTYTVAVSALSMYGPVSGPIDYTLSGAVLSDPFAADPQDPTANPFACTDPELAGFFCYPGNFISADPYLWNDFLGTLPSPPSLSLDALVGLLLGDWWSWVWGQTGTNGPVLAQDDRFNYVSPGFGGATGPARLTTPPNVLTNDFDPENGAFVAVLLTGPAHGTLTLAPDGAVNYTPSAGFVGVDSFTYQSYDFLQDSNVATARLVVTSGVAGDYNADGVLDTLDEAAWAAAYGSGAELLADGNGDGVVNAADFTIYRDALGAGGAPAIAPLALLVAPAGPVVVTTAAPLPPADNAASSPAAASPAAAPPAADSPLDSPTSSAAVSLAASRADGQGLGEVRRRGAAPVRPAFAREESPRPASAAGLLPRPETVAAPASPRDEALAEFDAPARRGARFAWRPTVAHAWTPDGGGA